jgi:hypothetical protein
MKHLKPDFVLLEDLEQAEREQHRERDDYRVRRRLEEQAEEIADRYRRAFEDYSEPM